MKKRGEKRPHVNIKNDRVVNTFHKHSSKCKPPLNFNAVHIRPFAKVCGGGEKIRLNEGDSPAHPPPERLKKG